jgi:tRNA threonylcarbamoyladenosine biosynthesis protein TsaB
MTNPNQTNLTEQSDAKLLLGIDTCGPTGSVALARLSAGTVEILGQTEIDGRSCSSTLVTAVAELLNLAGTQLGLLDAIVVVTGPGSFTGVRVGLAAVKGLAEGRRIPVVAASRLEVLAAMAGAPSDRSSSLGWVAGTTAAALDAHRQEIYLRLGDGAQPRELLAGAHELAEIDPAPTQIAVCDEAAERLLESVWPKSELVRVPAPTAADALRLCAPREWEFADLALLDGHYLRRSDAEIFGEATAARTHA